MIVHQDPDLEKRLYVEVARSGIAYLISPYSSEEQILFAQTHEPWPVWKTLMELASIEDVRLRYTIIPLMLLHPEWVNAIHQALRESQADLLEGLPVLALAALYLEQRWYLQLTLALGHPPCLPLDRFSSLWESLDLPAPWIEYGEAGLQALDARQKQRDRWYVNYLEGWENGVRHLLWDERYRRPHLLQVREIPGCMLFLPRSTRSVTPGPVNTAYIHQFLQQLADVLPQPYRLYLGSEATMVMQGVRESAAVLDVHVGREELPSMEIEAALDQPTIRWIADSAAYHVPLPQDWRERAQSICTIGDLEVYALDWVSVVLGKIAQGTSKHLADVQTIVQHGLVQRVDILHTYEEIQPSVGHGSFYSGMDADVFQQMVEAVCDLIFPIEKPSAVRQTNS